MTDSPTAPPPIDSLPDPAQVKTSKASIGSLVFGILSFCLSFLGSIPAVILGIVAIVKINNSGGYLTGKGLAIAGIVLGCVGLFVSAMLAAIALPAYMGVVERSKSVKQISSVRLLLQSCHSYSVDHDGNYPDKLRDIYPEYMDREDLFQVMNSDAGEAEDYLYFPGQTDVNLAKSPLIASPAPGRRNRRIVGYRDGHVEEMKEEDYQKMINSQKKKQ